MKPRLQGALAFALGVILAIALIPSFGRDPDWVIAALYLLNPGGLVYLVFNLSIFMSDFVFCSILTGGIVMNGLLYWIVWKLWRVRIKGRRLGLPVLLVALAIWTAWCAQYIGEQWPKQLPSPPPACAAR